ncbi:MAG TPA: acyltransferase [Gammaproteobacteria bacterium]|nr:acyltransferase [Gammaproteobacteria bacterium]
MDDVDLATLTLGEDETYLEPTTMAENRDIALAMARQARRYLYVFTGDLDPALYDSAEFAEALSALARSSERAHVHILVQDSTRASKDGHRVVELAQRLSSKVRIHRPSRQYADLRETFLVADELGYLYRTVADRYEAQASFRDRKRARELTRHFEEVWQRSEPDPQLRRLSL